MQLSLGGIFQNIYISEGLMGPVGPMVPMGIFNTMVARYIGEHIELVESGDLIFSCKLQLYNFQ